MLTNDYELEQHAVPVATNNRQFEKIQEMKRNGTLRFSLYFYYDDKGACRMLDSGKKFGGKIHHFDLEHERRNVIKGYTGGYTMYSPPGTFKPPTRVKIVRYFHSCGLMFLHEELR